MSTSSQNVFINALFDVLLRKETVPTGFEARANAVATMLDSDTSGLIESLTQFMVECATVDLQIDSEFDSLDEVLNEWLEEINSDFRGQGIQVGITGLMQEYFKERWRGSSFPVLKIVGWSNKKGLNVPSAMFFPYGGSIKAKKLETGNTLQKYEYFLGKDESGERLEYPTHLFYKPYVRWFDKYPVPFLIKRGVYKNWKLIDAIKDKESELINQLIPYVLLLKKGAKELQLADNPVTYNKDDLQKVHDKVNELVREIKDGTQFQNPTRVTNWDESWEHLIPKDLESMFKRELFISAERNILAGLGFIDIIEGVSTSRKDAIMNPKAFIKEVNAGINDFKLIIRDLLALIKESNPSKIKFNSKKWRVISNPVNDFVSEDFAEKIRNLYDRGLLSKETTVAVLGQSFIDYGTEVRRRVKETGRGEDSILYPPVIMNQEAKGQDFPGENPTPEVDENGDKIPTDKTDPTEKKQYNQAGVVLHGSPYSRIEDLPDAVKKLPKEKQHTFMKVFNNAYEFYLKKLTQKESEKRAFQSAWKVIKANINVE